MKRFDKIIFGFIMGSSFPLVLAMGSFLIWFYTNRNESIVIYYLVTGIILGIILNLLLLKKLIRKIYTLPIWLLVAFYMFYSINIYGFFMGLPIVNLLMGVLAGYYYSRRMRVNKVSLQKYAFMIIKISAFTALVTLLFCVMTAVIALLHENIGEELGSMLQLDFKLSNTTVLITIIFGTVGLVVCQYYLTRFVLIKNLAAQIK